MPLPLVGGGEQDMLSYSSQHPSSRNDVFSSHTGNVDSFYGPNVRQHSNARSCLNVNNLNAKPSSTAAPSVVNVFGRDEALLSSSSSSHNAQFNSQPLGFDNNTHLNNAVKTNHLDSGGFENVFSGGKDFNSVAESKSFSSSSFVSGVKSGHPTSKPRLTKVRRNANVSKGKATAQADNNTSRIESSGYNPLKSGISIKSKENQELRFTGSSTPSGFNVFDQSSKDETAMAALFKATKPSEHATSSVQFDKFFKQKPSVVQTEQSKVTYESVTGKGENEVLNQSHLSNNFKPLLHGNGNFKFDPGSYKKNEKVHNCNDFSQGSIPKQTETSYTFLNHEMKENNNNRGGDDRASNTAAKADKEYESKSFKQSDLVKDSKEELQARLRSWTPFSEFSSSDCSIGNSLSSSINKRDNSIFIFKGNLKDNSHANSSGKQDFHILRKSENTAFAKSKESSDFTFTFGRNMENLSNVSSGITTGAFKSEKFNVSDKSNGVFCFKSTSDALGTEKGQFERVREELQSRMKTWCPFVDDSKVKTEEGTDDNRHSPPGFVACETTPKENSFTTEPKEGLAAGDNTINTVMNSGHVTTRNDSNFSMPNRIFVDQEAASHGSFVFTSLAEEKDKSTLRSRENLEGYNSGSNDNGSFVFRQQSGIRKTASKNNKLESKSSGINSCVGIKNPFNLQKPHLGSSTGEKDGESKSESLSHSERLRLNKAANLCVGDHDTNFSAVALNKERIECENIGSAAHPMESSNVCEDSSTAYQQFPPGSFKETLNMASSGYSGIADARETKFKCEGTSVHNENSWPYRDENSWPFLQNLSASLNRIFEFNAARDSRQTNLSRKKRGKSHLPSSFQRRSAQHSTYTRSKRSEAASTLGHESGEGSPMDFSPYGETTASNESTSYCHGVFDAEKSSVPSTSSVPCSSHVNVNAYMSTDLEVKVEELRAAAVKLQIGTEGKPFEHKNMEKGSTGIESQNFQTKNDFNLNKAEHSNPGNDNQQQTINGVSFQHFQMNGGFNVNKTERFISKTHSQKQTNEEETSLPSSESEWLKSKMEQIKIEQSENSAGVKSEENNQNKRFTFVASPASNSMPVSNRRQFRRIYRPKVRGASHASNTDLKFVFPSPSFGVQGAILQQDAVPSEKDNHKFNSQTLGEAMDARDQSNVIVSQGLEKAGAMSESSQQPEERVATSSLRVAMSAKAEQACEKWRLRGNQAYANRDFPRAEDCYSRGASIVSVDETSRSCKRAAMLCYSNRAATRMAMGRLREALTDCKQAMAIDPKFLRVQLRAASCHLILGEYEEAIILFNQCRHSAKGMETSDLKIASEASEGLRKAQQGLDYVNHVGKLVETKRQDDLTNALQILNEALSVSPQAECLLHMKVSTLLSLQKYEEVIQVCEQSLDDAERNVYIESLDIQQGSRCLNEGSAKLSVKLWRWHMCAKANFYLGRLEETIEILSKYESAHSSLERARKESMESLSLFTAKVRDLLKHKYAGNKAFQEGKHAEAVEHYTAALSCNGDSRPFTAVCFCNRAAASQALGHVTDAIADCSRAIALDPNYPKAISRRATLHELVHDYAHACVDLQRLMNLLENQQQSKSHCSGKGRGSCNITQDLRQVRERLAKVQEEMKARNQLDHYLILGVEASSTTADIKKAYRKAALRHHPDKAGQFLSRSDEGGDTYWKEIEEEVRRDAERLFKMIGEAYTVLSDPGKRMQYDNEEELRKLRKRGTGSGSEGVEVHYYRYEQPSRWHRNRWGSFWEDAFENPHQRWQKYSDASQQDAYTRRTASSYRNSYRSRWTDWD